VLVALVEKKKVTKKEHCGGGGLSGGLSPITIGKNKGKKNMVSGSTKSKGARDNRCLNLNEKRREGSGKGQAEQSPRRTMNTT